eukprot:jgi/Chrzof1/12135/Cz06g22150.t1
MPPHKKRRLPREDSLTELEQQRLELIKRNQAMLRQLEVTAIADDIAQGIRTEQEEEKQRKRAKYMPVPGSAVRRSSRSAAQVAAVKLKQAVASSGTDSGTGDSDVDESNSVSDEEEAVAAQGLPVRATKEASKHDSSKLTAEPAEAADEYSPSEHDDDDSGDEGADNGSLSDDDNTDCDSDEQQQEHKARSRTARKRHKAYGNKGNVKAVVENDRKQFVEGDEDDEDDDWQLQMALQLSREGDAATPGGEAVACSAQLLQPPPASSIMEQPQQVPPPPAAAAAAAANAELRQPQPNGRTKQSPPLQPPSPAAANGADVPSGSKSTRQDSTGLLKRPAATKQRAGKPAKRQRAKQQTVDNPPGSDDIFQMFQMFQPGDIGILTRRHLAAQHAKFGLDVDDDKLNAMMEYAASITQEGCGKVKAASRLSYEAFHALATHLMVGEAVGSS